MQSGERLLVEAYAAIWLILLGFVWVVWRRTRGLEDKVAGLESALERARSEASPSKLGERDSAGS